MTELFVLCEHGKLEKHVEAVGCPDHSISHLAARAYADAPNVSCTVAHFVQCPGGHPATVEEVVEWLAGRECFPRRDIARLLADETNFTIACGACVAAWPHKEHSRDVWLYSGFDEKQWEAFEAQDV